MMLQNPTVCAAVHVVRRGDTLYQIAKLYGVTVPQLVLSNKILDPSGLRIGQKLCIPDDPMAKQIPDSDINFGSYAIRKEQEEQISPTNCRNGKLFQVQNESLIRLLELSGTSFAALICANPDVDFSQPLTGKQICMPNTDRFRTCLVEDIYVVRSGDTIDTIARRVGIPGDQLIQANPTMALADFMLRGMRICLPLR